MVSSSKIQRLNYGAPLLGLAKSIYYICCKEIHVKENVYWRQRRDALQSILIDTSIQVNENFIYLVGKT